MWPDLAPADALTLGEAFDAALTAMAMPDVLTTIRDWLATTYARAPALVLGLAMLLLLPPLALLGRVFRQGRSLAPTPDATQVYRRGGRGRIAAANEFDVPLWPSRAWIEGANGQRHEIDQDILRLGREDDNDICLPDKTVHRYHAAIQRTDDAQYLITDLSSAGGNGVLVNGLRVATARLNDGDTIDLGQTKLKFAANPA